MVTSGHSNDGFTLVEISIVLVIIGFLIGGVLVGRDMIEAARIRSQITQIDKYRTAVNTFRVKYNALPGDMNSLTAQGFGFALGQNEYVRGAQPGQGDGNGILEGVGNYPGPPTNIGYGTTSGENAIFFSDLSYANGLNVSLIDGSFNAQNAVNATFGCLLIGCGNPSSTTNKAVIDLLFPAARIGNGNYVYVYSLNSTNYFGVSAVYQINAWQNLSNPGLSVAQAYNIDQKVDDGVPLTGKVIAQYVGALSVVWVGTASSSVAVSGTSSTCYDNNGNIANPVQYSLAYNKGNSINCALSFQF